jgi:hypothetical protein
MIEEFKRVEEEFQKLKDQYLRGLISKEEFKKALENLMIKDKEGKYWMIGLQTGKWYYYDGEKWVQSAPPYEVYRKIICYSCEEENDVNSIFCVFCGAKLKEETHVCVNCGNTLKGNYNFCPACGKSVKDEKNYILKFKNLKIGPSLPFLCGFGLITGAIIGAFIGAINSFYKYITFLPPSLRDIHGSITGSLIYGLIGGISGFILIGLVGILFSLLLNFISYLFGGFKIIFKIE